jgi:hypothetical protein
MITIWWYCRRRHSMRIQFSCSWIDTGYVCNARFEV